ncbi:two component transcriptional regulator, LytTR family [Hydrobacter penzbergensis]|jgi:DNA-binding LytR/AlgR family response regulator|uniref:Two component transcriptional regulator, LytTR family n=1 Tax=Hydrobacter penzbergensis TaxID=1235997 RepID=A0A8X8LCU3_9BACT|nr:LytTR family DNA-binding domain-containing protein [Hydrobacter penzbergensis]MBN8717884.1 response regulator transcription factor [Sediminibacterium magnilacihabitans]PQV61473.1 LytTR family two component transcriptional regulator [Sediminibacterium magnilacihabitans]SDW48303.1 two component transcriptional regulator, LytTR family [Hydrobacter penzbergensis]
MIRCIAIDDEPLALQLINEYCGKIAFLGLEKVFTNTDEAKAYLNQNPVDLVFLDIQMPDINGIQFYKGLKQKPLVIFTTAYKDFAVEGFNVDAVDYLLKPFEYDRFLKAAYKAKEYLEFLSSQELQLNSIFVKVNYEIMKINLKDIELVEALDDYIKIYIKPNPVLTLMTLKSIQEKLPARDFVRVHRSFIVPLARIEKFSKTKLWIAGKEIPIGSSYSQVYDQLLMISKNK